jgi:hypothetical protein
MPMIEFFKIGLNDLTPYMDYQKYSMNNVPVYQTWTDGNMIEHRNSIRTRIEGSFQLIYTSTADFNSFLTLMSSAIQSNGYYSVSAYVQNTNSTESFEAFIEYDSESRFDFTNSREYHLVKMKVRQR